MKRLDLAEMQNNAPKGWHIERQKSVEIDGIKIKDVVEVFRVINGKNLRIWLKVLSDNRLDFICGVPKYIKVDTQAQLCGKKPQYIPSHNFTCLRAAQHVFNQSGLIDHLVDPYPFIVCPTYKGGKTKEEREEVLDEVNNAGIGKEKD